MKYNKDVEMLAEAYQLVTEATHTKCVDCRKTFKMQDVKENDVGAGYICPSCKKTRNKVDKKKV